MNLFYIGFTFIFALYIKDTEYSEKQKSSFFCLVFRGVFVRMATVVRLAFERQPLCSDPVGFELWLSKSREIRSVRSLSTDPVRTVRPNPLTNPLDSRTVRIVQTHLNVHV